MGEAGHLNSHQRDTLAQIFRHPLGHNIEWHSVISLLNAIGTVQETHKGHTLVTIGEETETFDPAAAQGHRCRSVDEPSPLPSQGRLRTRRDPGIAATNRSSRTARETGGHEGPRVTAPPVLAADIGGTQMRAALVDPKGRLLLRQSVPTPAEADVPASLIDLIATVAAAPGHGAPSHAVVGLPGAVDYAAGRLLWAPNLPTQWPGQLSASGLTSHLRLPVSIANDADLAAVGEATFGAGVGSSAVAYVTISTGIGAGVVHGGRLVRGTRSLAELGHVVIDWRAWQEGAPCTVEELGSGGGVGRLARAAGLGAVSARQVQALAEAGEPKAAAIWHQAIAACAAGLSNLIMSFYPSTVVIGGAQGRQDQFFGPLREMVMQRPGHHPADLNIVRSALSDDAGLAGAAAWLAAAGTS